MSRINFNIILAMLIVVLVISCTRDEIMLPVEPTPPVEPMDTMTMEPMGMDTMMMDTMMMDTMMMDMPTGPAIWEGDELTFSLADNSDHTLAENQDMLTPNVIITRSVEGGEFFNIAVEEASTKGVSPTGTEWAIGRTADGVENLSFSPFRTAVDDTPRRAVGTELVVHLIEDDIYLNVTLTSWSDGKRGGFEYVRATPN